MIFFPIQYQRAYTIAIYGDINARGKNTSAGDVCRVMISEHMYNINKNGTLITDHMPNGNEVVHGVISFADIKFS